MNTKDETKIHTMNENNISINYVASFGTLCVTSFLIKKLKLKKCSYPFDWIFSSPYIINDCLENDFKLFLDKDLYIDHNSKGDKCGHKIYNHNMFNHKDVRTTENYDYLVRCVERFRTLLKKEGVKLFIITYVRSSGKMDDTTISQINKLNNTLQKLTKNYNLLVINCLPVGKQNIEIKQTNNIYYAEMETISECNGVHFINPSDDNYYTDNILKLFNFDITDDIKTDDKDIM